MDVSEWQHRLEENFLYNGIVGGQLLDLFQHENNFKALFVQKFHGQIVLMDSFLSFFSETLNMSRHWILNQQIPKASWSYNKVYAYYLVMFRRFRSCEILLIHGYPLDGYALLRGLKDLIIVFWGMTNNLTTLSKVFGSMKSESFIDDSFKDVVNRRKKEEKKIWRRLFGKESALNASVSRELDIWERKFHEEVHGSKFSWAFTSQSMDKGKIPTPEFYTMEIDTDLPYLNYMSRAVEIGWLLLRLLPYLQPVQNGFGKQWHNKYLILDESFQFSEQSLGALGKEVASAFIEFVEKKFSFSTSFHFFEPDGSGSKNF